MEFLQMALLLYEVSNLESSTVAPHYVHIDEDLSNIIMDDVQHSEMYENLLHHSIEELETFEYLISSHDMTIHDGAQNIVNEIEHFITFAVELFIVDLKEKTGMEIDGEPEGVRKEFEKIIGNQLTNILMH